MKILLALVTIAILLGGIDAYAYGNWQDIQATATPYYVESGNNYNIEGGSLAYGLTSAGYWPPSYIYRQENVVQEVTCDFTRLSAYTNAQITKVEIRFTQDGSGNSGTASATATVGGTSYGSKSLACGTSGVNCGVDITDIAEANKGSANIVVKFSGTSGNFINMRPKSYSTEFVRPWLYYETTVV